MSRLDKPVTQWTGHFRFFFSKTLKGEKSFAVVASYNDGA
jgi:hypothetical protein